MPKKEIRVVMISSPGCDRCKIVERRILDTGIKLGVKVSVEKLDSRTPEALNLGIENGLDDIPSFVIGKKGFSGDSFHDSELESAMKGTIQS